ncbi:MAG: hypothetical protein KC535_03435 [Nanoarchaeota archaeon]|nr:hypothetical protein [Nanoarchaeota archaeon]
MKKLATIFVSLFLFASLVAADISVQDYTYTIARGDSDSQTKSVTNNINENVTIDFSATTLNSVTDAFSGVSFGLNPIFIVGVGSQDLQVNVNVPTSAEPGTYTGSIQYNSNNGSDTTSGSSTVTVTVTNEAPAITAIADQNIIVGNSFSYQVVATDAESDTLSYSLTQAPAGMTISATGLINGWTPVAEGTYAVTVEVSDGFDTTTESFSLTAQNDVPKIDFAASEVLLGDENQDRGTTVVQTITVENTGIQQLTNVQASLESLSGAVLNSEYNGAVSISKTSLAPGETAVVTVSVDIPFDQDSQAVTIGRVKVTADGTSNTITDTANLIMEAKSYLRIKDVEITIDGDDDNIDGGDTYDKIKEGDQVTIRVTLENRYSDNDNIKIENAYFQIESDDSDWDIDEESDETDIKEDKEEDFTVTFTIDDNLDDDQTDVTIRAYGEDEEDNFEHYDELTFSFEIDRERDEIRIISANLDKTSYSCTDSYANLDLKFKNTGTDDQDEVVIEVIASELDWHKRLYDLELDEGDSETESFRIPLNGESDDYFVEITAYVNNDEETDSEVIVIPIICTSSTSSTTTGSSGSTSTTTSPDENTVVVVTPPTTSTTDASTSVVYGKPVGALDDFRDSNLYVVLLVALIVFVLGGIFLLGTSLFKK